MRRIALALALTVLSGAASPRPANAAPTASPTPEPAFCSVGVHVEGVDGVRRRYAISFGGLVTETISGTVALYAGGSRFEVPFKDVVSVDTRDKTTRGGALVVEFPKPVALESAAVSRLTAPEPISCDVPYSPWRASRPRQFSGDTPRTPEAIARHARYLEWARTAPAVDVPPPVSEPVPACADPDRYSSTTDANQPYAPEDVLRRLTHAVTAIVLVVLNADDSIAGARIESSTGYKELDNVAIGAALRSKFRGETFRCKPVIGAYLFSVDFDR